MIETERLLLRRWQDADREPFARLNADPVVMEHFVTPLTREESDRFLDKWVTPQFDELGYGLWAVERRSDGRFLGFTGLLWQDFPAAFTPALEVGWRFERQAWGYGYASEAARASLEFAFTQLPVDEVVSLTSPHNHRSIAVMERIGMTRDPNDDFDHPRVPAGHRLRRHVLYRIDKQRWQSLPQSAGRSEGGES